MNVNVTVNRYGKVHYIAGCNDCDFVDAISVSHPPAAVRRTVRKHVVSTGHSVWVEAGTHTLYTPSNKGLEPTPLADAEI